MAIPVSHVRRFLARPEIRFAPPVIEPLRRSNSPSSSRRTRLHTPSVRSRLPWPGVWPSARRRRSGLAMNAGKCRLHRQGRRIPAEGRPSRVSPDRQLRRRDGQRHGQRPRCPPRGQRAVSSGQVRRIVLEYDKTDAMPLGRPERSKGHVAGLDSFPIPARPADPRRQARRAKEVNLPVARPHQHRPLHANCPPEKRSGVAGQPLDNTSKKEPSRGFSMPFRVVDSPGRYGPPRQCRTSVLIAPPAITSARERPIRSASTR